MYYKRLALRSGLLVQTFSEPFTALGTWQADPKLGRGNGQLEISRDPMEYHGGTATGVASSFNAWGIVYMFRMFLLVFGLKMSPQNKFKHVRCIGFADCSLAKASKGITMLNGQITCRSTILHRHVH